MTSKRIVLVTGGASCGKSEWAESLAQQTNLPVIYIATGQKNEQDEEWKLKIAKHRQRRPKSWQNWEIPLKLAEAIANSPEKSCLLIDSLGTWVANWLDKDEAIWQEETEKLINQLNKSTQTIIFVGEETGWGVVPAYELGRLFRNRLGNLSRKIGLIADRVYVVIGGYAVDIAQIGMKIDQ